MGLGGGSLPQVSASSSAFSSANSSATQNTGDIILGGGSKANTPNLLLLGGLALAALILVKKL